MGYIQFSLFSKSMILLKIGGQKNIDFKSIGEDLKTILKDQDVIVVHGANEVRDEIAKNLGSPTKIIHSPSGISSVLTDERARNILLMAYPGLVNSRIVAQFQSLGINAVGLSGIDGKLWLGKRKQKLLAKQGARVKVIRDSYTGKVYEINADLINILIKNNYTPVISTPAVTNEGEIINVDNDTAIVEMVRVLKITKIVSLFGADGLMKDVDNQLSLVKEIYLKDIEHYFKYAQGRMKKKIMAAKSSLENNVTVYWGNINQARAITATLNGNGTVLKPK